MIVSMTPEVASFEPSLQKVTNSINDLLKQWETTARDIENMTPDAKFEPFTSPLINNKVEEKTCGDGPNFRYVLKNDNMYRDQLVEAVEIHRELPVIARDGIDRIMAEVQDGQVRLEYSPVVTQDYVRFLSFLDEFQITVDNLEVNSSVIQDLYAIIDSYKIGKPPEDFAQFQELEQSIYNSKNLIDRALSGRDQILEKFSKSADKDAAELMQESKNQMQRLKDRVTINVAANILRVTSGVPCSRRETRLRRLTQIKELRPPAQKIEQDNQPIGPGNASDVFVDVGPIDLLTGGEGPIVTSVDSPSEAQLAILQLSNEN
ncbi:dynein heavy chain 6, axonemal-like [Plakobranchus ocellatus]|uniref:Dynein heavy chain 6, axonemal-like n=1 Tax=Plakobranchus ocellatus TaxID=259542 RepID=A0AAV4A165_9GAST|nr:dynein heavy chain 6, axonemal-like [Plakobranchus ocellatus]